MNDGLNPDFITNIYDNELNKNPDMIRQKFEAGLLNTFYIHLESKYNSNLRFYFGDLNGTKIDKYTCIIKILYYDVYVYYSQKRDPRVISIDVIRNKREFIT